MQVHILPDLDALGAVAHRIISYLDQNRNILLLEGDLGAGKTTLIKTIANLLKVEDEVSSPTFSIVNEYWSKAIQKPIYHFDLYRLEDSDALFEIGIESYLSQDALFFIEWPELILGLIEASKTVRIRMEHEGESFRKLSILS